MISPDERKCAVEAWQASPYVHPLTCGNDSSHALLVPSENDQGFCIKCPDCGWEQSYKAIPTIVWMNYFESYKWTNGRHGEIVRKSEVE